MSPSRAESLSTNYLWSLLSSRLGGTRSWGRPAAQDLSCRRSTRDAGPGLAGRRLLHPRVLPPQQTRRDSAGVSPVLPPPGLGLGLGAPAAGGGDGSLGVPASPARRSPELPPQAAGAGGRVSRAPRPARPAAAGPGGSPRRPVPARSSRFPPLRLHNTRSLFFFLNFHCFRLDRSSACLANVPPRGSKEDSERQLPLSRVLAREARPGRGGGAAGRAQGGAGPPPRPGAPGLPAAAPPSPRRSGGLAMEPGRPRARGGGVAEAGRTRGRRLAGGAGGMSRPCAPGARGCRRP